MAGCQGAWYLSSKKWHMMVGKPLQSASSNHPQIYKRGKINFCPNPNPDVPFSKHHLTQQPQWQWILESKAMMWRFVTASQGQGWEIRAGPAEGDAPSEVWPLTSPETRGWPSEQPEPVVPAAMTYFPVYQLRTGQPWRSKIKWIWSEPMLRKSLSSVQLFLGMGGRCHGERKSLILEIKKLMGGGHRNNRLWSWKIWAQIWFCNLLAVWSWASNSHSELQLPYL